MISQQLTLSDRVVQKAGSLVSDMDGDKVMLCVETGKYYNLGATGGRIWELIAAETSIGEVVGSLEAEYDIEPSACEEQVIAFLNHLTREGLIQIRKG